MNAYQQTEIVTTQVRLPKYLHDYITEEAARLGIAKNAMLIILADRGRREWEGLVATLQSSDGTATSP